MLSAGKLRCFCRNCQQLRGLAGGMADFAVRWSGLQSSPGENLECGGLRD